MPAIHALRDAFPDAEINALANKAIASLALEAIEIDGIGSLDDSGLAPFCSETGPILRRLGERRALPSRGGPIKTRCDFRGSAGREKRCNRDRRNETRRFHIWMIESKPQGARE